MSCLLNVIFDFQQWCLPMSRWSWVPPYQTQIILFCYAFLIMLFEKNHFSEMSSLHTEGFCVCVGIVDIFLWGLNQRLVPLRSYFLFMYLKMIVSRLNVVMAWLQPWPVSSTNRGVIIMGQSKYEVLIGWHSSNRVFLKKWDWIWHGETGKSWLPLFILP